MENIVCKEEYPKLRIIFIYFEKNIYMESIKGDKNGLFGNRTSNW